MRKRRFVILALGLVVLLVVFGGALSRRVRAAQLLSSLANAHRTHSTEVAGTLEERELEIPAVPHPIRARLYAQKGKPPGPGLVIAHGVHYRGIDEARLIPFARELARSGLVVLTPEIADIKDYRITTAGTDVIARSARWFSEQHELIQGEKVGILGFSFAGGLGLVAAGRPELENRVAYVTSVGGHHDLGRVLGFLVKNEIETPKGLLKTQAHDYGLVVLVYQYVDRFVDEPDRVVMTDALRHWLHDDHARARTTAAKCTTESGKRLFSLLERGRLRELAPELERLIAEHRDELRAVSPRGRLRALNLPVYLLHGQGDSVIPPSETDWAATELEGHEYRALVSPLLEHVEVNHAAKLGDELELVEFMAHLL
jgi:pimeloyl-ACP methyl ester carboxylesterase